MPQWLQNLFEGWPMIRGNLPLFAVIVVLVVVVVWGIFNFSYSTIISSKDAQIELQDRQIKDYKDKLGGATPDEAKARIDALAARLSAIEPRRLTKEQRAELATNLKPPWGSVFSVYITTEMVGNNIQFGADIAAAFQAASNWNVSTASFLGGGIRPATGIAIVFPDANHPPQEATLIMNALRKGNIKFDIQNRKLSRPDEPVEIMITAIISP